MKSLMLSIRPEWARKILSGEKNVEVRKTKPRLKPPFKAYIYETFSGGGTGKVVAEFTCNKIASVFWDYTDIAKKYNNQGDNLDLLNGSCLTREQIFKYCGSDSFGYVYGINITDLKIYECPKHLSRFKRYGNTADPFFKHPPQSWCYIEETED